MSRKCIILAFIVAGLALASFVAASDFEEHGTGGALDNTWVPLGTLSYNDTVNVIADASAPDADGYVLEFFDRDNSYFGIANACTTDTAVWLDLTLDAWVYAHATAQNGANCQVGFLFRADPTVETKYARVLLNLPATAGEVKLQTYDGAWTTETFDIDNAWATTGWHHLIIQVGGADHNEVTLTLDGHLLGTRTMPALGSAGTLAAAGPIGLSILHYNAAPPIAVYYDNIRVNPDTQVKDWAIY